MKLKLRYVELDGETAIHLEDAVNAGLIRDTTGTSLRYTEADGELYVGITAKLLELRHQAGGRERDSTP